MGQHFVSGPVVLKAPVAPENEQTFVTNHKETDKLKNTHKKMHASLSPELYCLVVAPFSHGCRDVFSLEQMLSIII